MNYYRAAWSDFKQHRSRVLLLWQVLAPKGYKDRKRRWL